MASAAPSENTALVCVGPVKRGRPSAYSEEIAREICERIAGNETLTAICADEHMPHASTVGRWLLRRADFSREYADARATQMHLEAEEIREIADNLAILPEHKRIMVDARKWRAERLNRQAYGNSVKHEHEHAVHPAHEAERLPAGLAWLGGILPPAEKKDEE